MVCGNFCEGLTAPCLILDGTYISETELLTLKDKSNRHMRLRELVMEYSRRSDLVVMYGSNKKSLDILVKCY